MTIATTVQRVDCPGNGSATVFSFAPIPIFSADDLVVTKRDASSVETTINRGTGPTDYSVGLSTFPGTGSITYPAVGGTPLATGETLVITRQLALLQSVHLENQGGYFPAVQETEFDRLTAMIQQLQEQVDRCLKIGRTDTGSVQLPTKPNRINQLLGFDSNGVPTPAQTTSVLVSSAMQPVVLAATVDAGLALLDGAVAFPTMAALQAYAGTAPPIVALEGYYSAADGGAGVFTYVASDTTSADNGGTIVVDANGRRWFRQADSFVSAKWFGARGDNTTDDTIRLQAWLTYLAATASIGFLPVGRYIVSATLTASAAVSIVGAGTGVGPGLANGPASIIRCKAGFTTGDVFTITTVFSCLFRDFQISGPGGSSLGFTSVVPRSSGAGLHIVGPNPATNSCSRVENVAFNGLYVGLQMTLCVDQIVRGCYFQCYKAAGYYANGAGSGIECSAGHVNNNKFFGDPTVGTTQVTAILSSSGYTNINDNLILGGQYGIQVLVNEHSLGHIGIKDNNIEEQTIDSILIQQVNPYGVFSIQIDGNEFSNITNTQIQNHVHITGATAGSMFDVGICDNDFSSTMLGGATAAINVQYCTNAIIARNRFNISACYAVLLGANAFTVSVLDNRIQGSSLTGTTGYSVQTSTVLRDLASRTFTVALLPTPDVGSTLWVTNGHGTNLGTGDFTVISGGTGCIATYSGAGWKTIDA